MNRRSFLAKLAALPIVARLAPRLAPAPTPINDNHLLIQASAGIKNLEGGTHSVRISPIRLTGQGKVGRQIYVFTRNKMYRLIDDEPQKLS